MERKIGLQIAFLAAGTLLLESAFLRLLAVAQYYHFAFLVVSLALLGFGASGSLLSAFPKLKQAPLSKILAVSGGGFAGSTGVAYLVVNYLPFDSYSIAWDPLQILYFLLYFLAMALPFLFSGTGIAAGLAAAGEASHSVYAANLLGSAVGAGLGLLIMGSTGVPGTVLASCLATLPTGYISRPVRGFVLAAGLGGLVFLGVKNAIGEAPLGLVISPYKGLAYARQYPGSQEIFGKWSPVSRIDLVARAGIRQLPGLSYTYQGAIPEQVGVSLDGNTLQPVSLVSPEEFSAHEFLPENIAFELATGPHLLVLNPGGGLGLIQGLAAGFEQVTAVVGDPILVEAVDAGAGLHNPYAMGRVRVFYEQPREYLQHPDQFYDLVYLPLTDAYRPISSGAYSLTENYLLTVESVEKMLAALHPDGILVISRWLQTPPSESLRIAALLAEALGAGELAGPDRQIVAFRGFQTITVLVRPAGWRKLDLNRVRSFLTARKFDLVWAPDIKVEETNRYNQLLSPDYYHGFRELLASENPDVFSEGYRYALDPPRDDRPFFFHFYSWQQAPEIFATFGKVWQPFGGSGFLLIVALLALVVLLSGVLILLPLFMRNPVSERQVPDRGRWWTLLYFGSVGLGFLFVEIPLIQRWILLLGHPAYSFAMVVSILLLFSSFGSRFSARVRGWDKWILGIVFLLVTITPVILDAVITRSLGWPGILRLGGAALSLAPLAFVMGLPFPIGLARLGEIDPALLPWAWAVNGCASVIAAVLAALCGLAYGFSFVLGAGAVMYALAWIALSGLTGKRLMKGG